MDPNACLREMETLLSTLVLPEGGWEELVGLRDALQGWLSRGGFEPDWAACPKATAWFRGEQMVSKYLSGRNDPGCDRDGFVRFVPDDEVVLERVRIDLAEERAKRQRIAARRKLALKAGRKDRTMVISDSWAQVDRETIREWASGPFFLSLWNTFGSDSRGRSVLGYEFRHDGSVIFSGENFCSSPLHADDSDATVSAILSFLSMKPGDTDREYFESYSAEQLEWADLHGEELAVLALEMEEQAREGRES